MAIVEKLLSSVGLEHYYEDYWIQESHPNVERLFLLSGGPWTLLSLIGAYLVFVKIVGPNLMKNKKPFALKGPILVYNSFMVLVNGWLFTEAMWKLNFGKDVWGCHPTLDFDTPKAKRFLLLGYVFFLSKIFEFLDTIFFILRKKFNQVSVLHVVHHSTVPVVCWMAAKFGKTTTLGFFPLANALVHVIMYTYYALAALGPNVQKYLWWKKYLTQMQLIQFVFIFIHSLHLMIYHQNCESQRMLFPVLETCNATMYLYLFGAFYVNAYLKQRREKESIKKTE